VYKWFATRSRTEESNLQAEVSIGFDLLKLISSKLKADASVRHEIKQEDRPSSASVVYKSQVLILVRNPNPNHSGTPN
ncbi:hypothetical protein GNE08_26005, partial [Trichormus variabilis ARAD]|nr:hypothetical protein [Trichormus variabilis ARAD]